MLNVKGKWALITGGSRGVGREIAKSMAGLGAALILQSRDVRHAEALARELATKGVQVKLVACDLENEASIAAMLAEIDSFGTDVDIVFNNAGLMSKYFVNYFENTLPDCHQALAVNFLAPVRIADHFLPKMVDRGFGRMLLTTSGIANEPELMAYACAKAALTKFVKDFANKFNGTDVMLNLMDPGWLRTDLGGPKAPNAVESVIPGALVGNLLDDRRSGRLFAAQDYAGLTVDAALGKAESAGELPGHGACVARKHAGNTLPEQRLFGNDRTILPCAGDARVNNLLCQKRMIFVVRKEQQHIPELGALRLVHRDGERRIDIFRGERGQRMKHEVPAFLEHHERNSAMPERRGHEHAGVPVIKFIRILIAVEHHDLAYERVLCARFSVFRANGTAHEFIERRSSRSAAPFRTKDARPFRIFPKSIASSVTV